MQVASRTTVRGVFAGQRIGSGENAVVLYSRHGRYFARARGADGRVRDWRIRYTFGVAPLQQYLVAAPGGRLQVLDAAWDVSRGRWFSLAAGAARPGDAMHWSGRYHTWNLMCAECHSTAVEKSHDAAQDSYRTTWAAINVGCQACHGAGRRHVASARRGRPDAMPARHDTAAAEVDQCARCHSVRSRLVDRPDPAQPFLDQYRPETLRSGLYFADGQQDGEVFEVGSFRQSKMHRAGVRCSDCHDVHRGTLLRQGNALCTSCHGAPGDPRFAAAAARQYDDPAHHHHVQGQPGSGCIDCHMPAATYMQVHDRRDHSLRVPRPDLAVDQGLPEPCTRCHRDRDGAWARAQSDAWWPELPPDRHAAAFAAARQGDRASVPALVGIATDGSLPGPVRATASQLLGSLGATVPPEALRDGDGQVRAEAAAASGGPGFAADLWPLLDDPLRGVRIAAARTLAASTRGEVDAARKRALDKGIAEYRAAQSAMSDAPAAHLALAGLDEDLDRAPSAAREYRLALAMDRQLVPARLGLARVLAAQGDPSAAVAILREGCRQQPEVAELALALGLLLGHQGQYGEAEGSLAVAARLRPNWYRARLNHGLVLMRLGRDEQAMVELQAAAALPSNDDLAVRALRQLGVAGRGGAAGSDR
jgi:Flp pilus assembly protein TadD